MFLWQDLGSIGGMNTRRGNPLQCSRGCLKLVVPELSFEFRQDDALSCGYEGQMRLPHVDTSCDQCQSWCSSNPSCVVFTCKTQQEVAHSRNATNSSNSLSVVQTDCLYFAACLPSRVEANSVSYRRMIQGAKSLVIEIVN